MPKFGHAINTGRIPILGLRAEQAATAAAPATPVEGLFWNDTDLKVIKVYLNGAWVTLGEAGSAGPPTGAAGGDLTGNYPNPTIAATKVVMAYLNADTKDQVAGTASMRSLGVGAQQAMAGNTRLDTIAAPTGSVGLNAQRITGLANGSAATDAVNVQQLDAVAAGLDPKGSVKCASTANLGLSGLGAVDGVTPNANDRVLAKNQTTGSQNGIWLAQSGSWTRATDMDNWAEVPGAFTFVEQGTVNADTGWVCTADIPGTINTTSMAWTQFSGPGEYIAGGGIGLSVNTFSVAAGNGIVQDTDGVSVNFVASGGDNGTAITVARSDHDHDSLYPPTTRTINTTAPLQGGGNLSATRTLTIDTFTQTVKGAVPPPVSAPSGKFLKDDGTWAAAGGGTVNKYAVALGALTAGVETVVTHGLGTTDVIASYRTLSDGIEVLLNTRVISATQVGVTADVAYGASAVQAVVIG